ncbi:MAG: hypothetical protein LBC51_06575 [Treponema sp.]|jgi:hypothetical protein|nr:hypothetical protein [Treponema sp.]
MANYLDIQKEETLKARVFHDYFDKGKFAYEPNTGNIDFIVTDARLAAGGLFKAHYLWAEAKKGEVDAVSMMTQLVLTCKKTYDSGEFMPPPYLGCFDGKKIAFLPFHDILPVFAENDINWNAAPSNYLSDDFIKTRKKITKLLAKNFTVYDFDEDSAEIKSFIKNNFIPGMVSTKSPITKNNFPHIYNRWVTEVKPTINISADRWQKYKREGVLDLDFFLADVMSRDGKTIIEKLNIILDNDNYKLQKDIEGELFKTDINFTDGGAAYRRFWNKYERPPAEEYQQYMIGRRDLLVPKNIREVKGSFFTPQIWVEKSQEYIAKALGENWQEEYTIWDCAAGTGNLLAGLANKYNIWASTIDQPDVDTMKALIDEGFNVLPAHVFRFDFLNDTFDKLPPELKKILDDPEKRKKLIIYINPPYAEATSTATAMGRGHNKGDVATAHKTRDKYKAAIGSATNEISAQFMARIYHEIPECKLALFSKLKFVNGQNFSRFREFFNADFKKGFAVCADTFDNVAGKFPIGFTVWDLSGKKFPKNITLDVAGNRERKRFWALDGKSINKWIIQFNKTVHEGIAYMANPAPDFQKINQPYITAQTGSRHFHYYVFNKSNVIEGCIYFAVRLCIEPTWLNDRDQFLFPNDGYKTDTEFQNDCLIFTLFHGQNRISCVDGVNHWIPFTEQEVDASEKFDSNFMSKYIKGKTFSNEANSVLNTGLELWKYYHAKTKGNNTVSVNASFYDIREYFQGRAPNGKMNNKSADETYNKIIKMLRNHVKLLAQKIEPKIYEYGFLK